MGYVYIHVWVCTTRKYRVLNTCNYLFLWILDTLVFKYWGFICFWYMSFVGTEPCFLTWHWASLPHTMYVNHHMTPPWRCRCWEIWRIMLWVLIEVYNNCTVLKNNSASSESMTWCRRSQYGAMFSRIQQSNSFKCALELEEKLSTQNIFKRREEILRNCILEAERRMRSNMKKYVENIEANSGIYEKYRPQQSHGD